MRWIKGKKRVFKSYSFISMLANFLVALSVTGLSMVGVLTDFMSITLILCIVIPLGLFGLIGRFIDQELSEDSNDCKS